MIIIQTEAGWLEQYHQVQRSKRENTYMTIANSKERKQRAYSKGCLMSLSHQCKDVAGGVGRGHSSNKELARGAPGSGSSSPVHW